MERFKELVSFITDLTVEDDRYRDAYPEERKIDYEGFRKRMMEYLERRREAERKSEGAGRKE